MTSGDENGSADWLSTHRLADARTHHTPQDCPGQELFDILARECTSGRVARCPVCDASVRIGSKNPDIVLDPPEWAGER